MAEDRFILLVDDSPDDAYFFQRALRRAGIPCECQHALNGLEAVKFLEEAQARQNLPAAVFLDLKMPLMNGFEVLRWVQQQPFALALRVFVLSGSNQQEDRDRAQHLGASGYLVKPVTADVLTRTVSDTASSQRAGA